MKRIVLAGILMFAFMSITAFAQQRITGTVTDAADGSTLPGVSVVVKGTTTGTITDMNGRYELSAPADGTLVFSFVGYTTTEVAVQGRDVINVPLETALVGLEEVIVIAYGTVRRESFTGVADVVTSDKIERRPVSNISRALEGVAPGVQVSSSSGQPGDGDAIRLRGFGSVSSSNAPLYVLDGVPFDGTLNSINPADIESITILRDASAAALYGARGANGVIMINTKRGSSQRPVMSFNSRVGISERALPEFPRVNEKEYYELMWEAYRNDLYFKQEAYDMERAGLAASGLEEGTAGIFEQLGYYNPFNVDADQLIDPVTGLMNPNAQLMYSEDWQDALSRTGIRQDYQFNVSGGSDISDYYISLGYLNEEGIIKKSDFERINARLNLNAQPVSWFETGLNISGSTAKTNFFITGGTQTTNPFYFTRVMGPIYPVHLYDDAGNVVLDDNGNKVFDYGNPYTTADGDEIYRLRPYAGLANLAGTLVLDDRSHLHETVGARTYAQFNIIEGLNFRTSLSTDYYSRYQTTFQNPEFGDAANVQGRSTKNFHRNMSITFNQLLNFNRQFGEHNFDMLLGHESYSMKLNRMFATRVGFPIPGITEIGIGATATDSNSWEHNYRIEGYFSRISYDFRNKYYVSGSFRRDGSSRFHEDYRWGNFWSIGTSWRASQEDFLRNIDWLDNLRVKASYGEQGNDALLDGDGNSIYYAWQGFYDLGVDNYNYNGALLSSLENRSLVWEVNRNTNLGFDFRIFDRFQGEVDFFQRASSNLLFRVPLPTSTGITEINMNIGEMVNNGVEFRLLIDILKNTDLRWSTDFNITHFRNEITKLPDGEGIVSGTKRLEEGRSLYDFWIREFAGVDPENGDALYYMDELDEDGEPTGNRITTNSIADADRYYVGTSIPDFYGGFTNNFNYRNFDLSILTTYSYGGVMYDNAYLTLMHEGRYGTHWHRDILDRWQQPGDITDVPRLENGNSDLNGFSSRHLFDMSYISIKNVTLGYNVPRQFVNQYGISNMRLFVSGDNLITFNEKEGMNPQHSFAGAGNHDYFPVRTITFGANLQF